MCAREHDLIYRGSTRQGCPPAAPIAIRLKGTAINPSKRRLMKAQAGRAQGSAPKARAKKAPKTPAEGAAPRRRPNGSKSWRRRGRRATACANLLGGTVREHRRRCKSWLPFRLLHHQTNSSPMNANKHKIAGPAEARSRSACPRRARHRQASATRPISRTRFGALGGARSMPGDGIGAETSGSTRTVEGGRKSSATPRSPTTATARVIRCMATGLASTHDHFAESARSTR